MKKFLKQLEELDRLKLSKGDYAIAGSGPLAIRGIREANDIDLIVKKDVWETLILQYPSGDEKFIRIGNLEIGFDFLNLTPILDEVIDNAEEIEGYPFLSLEHTISWKTYLNREKDKRDIALIEDYKLREATCL